jgi:hypothetical protein
MFPTTDVTESGKHRELSVPLSIPSARLPIGKLPMKLGWSAELLMLFA